MYLFRRLKIPTIYLLHTGRPQLPNYQANRRKTRGARKNKKRDYKVNEKVHEVTEIDQKLFRNVSSSLLHHRRLQRSPECQSELLSCEPLGQGLPGAALREPGDPSEVADGHPFRVERLHRLLLDELHR